MVQIGSPSSIRSKEGGGRPAHAQLKRIRLELARSKEYPDGSFRHGYEFVAPLDASCHIDLHQWLLHRPECRVSRFWSGEEDRQGYLVHKPGTGEHAFWAFDYNPDASDDDEPGYRFGSHAFAPGEYVTIRNSDGEQHTFRVTTVTDVK
jgi:hypothetical protein